MFFDKFVVRRRFFHCQFFFRDDRDANVQENVLQPNEKHEAKNKQLEPETWKDYVRDNYEKNYTYAEHEMDVAENVS